MFSKLDESGGDWKTGGKYEQIMRELETRYPFQNLLDKDWEESLPQAWERIKELEGEIKKLKRHKHDDKTGDVLIRI